MPSLGLNPMNMISYRMLPNMPEIRILIRLLLGRDNITRIPRCKGTSSDQPEAVDS